MIDSVESLGGAPLTLHWRVRKQLLYLWEIDVEALTPAVPAFLDLLEVRPGRGLLAVEVLHYHTDHFRPGYREFLEIVLTAAVQPDLSVKMPVPRFCMHAISVYSDSPEFVQQEAELLFTPTELVPGLRFAFSDDGCGADIYDAEAPILSMKNTHAAPDFAPKVLFGQYYTNTRGLELGLWRWEGEMFEHMKSGDSGKLYPHAFWKGIDIRRVRGCYRQMIARPGSTSSVRFFHRGAVKR
jgi:hypothetical protein